MARTIKIRSDAPNVTTFENKYEAIRANQNEKEQWKQACQIISQTRNEARQQ